MKIINLTFTFILLVSCAARVSHAQDPLDELFKQNLDVSDAFANGKISRNQLTTQQFSFMYLLMGWSGRPAQFDHYKGLKITTDDVSFWRTWYARKKEFLEYDVIQKAITLVDKMSKEGILSDEEMDFLDQTSKKIRAL